MHFEQFEGLLNQVTKIVGLSLAVINFVSQIVVSRLEEIHDWKDLSVIWNEGLTDGVTARHEALQNFEGDGDDLWVTGVQGGLNWDNQLWNDGEDLSSTLLEHVEHTLDGEEPIWVNFLSDTFKENREIMMVIKLLNLDFPGNFVLWAMLDGDWQVTSVVKKSELTDWDSSPVSGSSNWLLNDWLLLGQVQAGGLTSETITLLQDCGA